jgi:hypothetical protein
MLGDRLGLSERRACRYVGQHRSTQRRAPIVAADDQALRAALRQIAGERPRWGYRRAHHELCGQGWAVNRKRTQRLWREEGLRVAPRARKRPRPSGQPDRSALRATGPDEVWAIDFQHDMTADGRALRLVNVVDEFTREALVMRVSGPSPPMRPCASWRRWSPGEGAHHGSCAAITGPSSRHTRCGTGVASVGPRRRSSSPARRGRTRSWSPSTPACATSCSI